ncbi:Rrf2 family transcriptional regulator [Oricola sp.]|uniref:Rrf2 family transcriptional regulator n=1 Tax=Oricola sp. TaxID=1979950 RepID=UPI003BACD03A
MQLTKFSDYALRVLMYVDGADDRLVTIDEIAGAYGVSRAHLMKVVNALTRTGYLASVRGRNGGLRLSRPAEEIRLGDVIRKTEPDMALVECFGGESNCAITGCCRLPNALHAALEAFIAELDRHTLADVSLSRNDFAQRLALAD